MFTKLVYVITFAGFMILSFSTKKCQAALTLLVTGKPASCTRENQPVYLPILAGNPCITCKCKSGEIVCERQTCPQRLCRGIIRRSTKKCCPDCLGSSICFHKGQSHQNGESWFEENCMFCSCRSGKVECEKQRCSENPIICPQGQKPGLVPGSCCLQCVEDTSTCTTYGDPHYQTFDNKMYNFQGSCKYLLTSDCRRKTFSVRVRNERRSSRLFSWTKHVAIHVGKTVIVLYQNLEVRVNRTKVSLPFYHLPRFHVTKSNFMISVVTDLGLQVSWDGDSYTEIQVPNRFRGALCGLCGNFNGKANDDLKLRNGKMASSITEFGNSWAVGKRRTCNRAPAPPILSGASQCTSFTKLLRARRKCSALKSPSFSLCYSKVKPNEYYNSCVTDMCQCKNGNRCACASLMAYVRACKRQGILLRWRTNTACSYLDHEALCKGGTVYSDCVSPCRQTCSNLTNNHHIVTCNKPCTPGCQCPAGKVWHVKKCISKRKCLARMKKKQTKLTGRWLQ